MKIKIQKSQLFEGLKNVQSVVNIKSSLQIINNVLMEAENNTLKLTATDLDITIISTCECVTEEAGATTLPVKMLFNLIAKADDGEVTINADNSDKAEINCGNLRLRLSGKQAQDFPQFNYPSENVSHKLKKQMLKDMLRKTYYAASQDDTRRTLKGVMMNFSGSKLTMVATDGRRLAMMEQELDYNCNEEQEVVLPIKTVNELLRLLDDDGECQIICEKGKVGFELGKVKIFSKVAEDKYPNYRQVIPESCKEKITIDRQMLLNALERASVMSLDEAHSTKLIFENNQLLVTSAASEIGDTKDSIPVKYAGERIEIVFNPNYVMEPLKAIEDEEIFFNFNNGHTPAVIRCSIPFLYVLMPLRVG